jgi:CPA1 family monovalent cation:H+ antiporter
VELHDEQLVQLLGLLVAVAALLVVAPVLRVPYPILLVVGGLALGFVPGLPEFRLPPDLVLIAFLPPLLYSAAFFTSIRDLRGAAGPVSFLALGVVAATTAGVAVVAHWAIDGITWPAAFVLGAVVSPTDPIAATAIARRLGVPRRVVTVIEGESLVNDASALVIYRAAIVAAVAGTFSFAELAGLVVVSVIGGVAIGLAVGYVVRQVRRRIEHSPTEITIALLTGYLAYLPAEALGVSAVLAAVTVGIYMGWYTPELTTAETRLQGEAFWSILVFVLNAALFTLVGLQLPQVLDGLDGWTTGELVGAAAAICGAVVLIRVASTLPFTYLQRLFGRSGEGIAVRRPLFVSWTGMRGAVSLAAALAIPLETDAGAPFPARELIIFLAFCVILVTLVVQGLSLPFVIRALRLEDDGVDAREDAEARVRAAEAALARLEQLVDEEWVREDTAERVRGTYRFRADRFGERLDGRVSEIEERSQAFQRLRRELLDAEREAVVELRRSGVISDDVMNRVLRDIALEDVRLDR